MLVAAVLAWSLLAVGGVYVWARIPIVVLGLTAALVLRPGIARHGDVRPLDLSLLLVVAAMAAQLLPLPFDWRVALSPQLDVDRRVLLLTPSASSARPLSLDPAATAGALALVATVVALYWSVRHLCGRGHLWRVIRVVAIVGLIGAAAALVQRAADPLRIYGLWLPQDAGARPFGPFVNRNHFATWLLMATSLMAGALVAGLQPAGGRADLRSAASAAARMLGSRRGLAGLALAAMILALVASLSRAAFVAAAAAALVWGLLALQRASRRAVAAGIGVTLLLAAGAASMAPAPLLARVQETIALGAAGRAAIWHDAATVARAYPIAGTGMGSYARAMLVHQTSPGARPNHAHNHYLHQLVEGGALVAVPLLTAVAAFLWLAGRRLAADRSPTAWLRIGAIAAVAAVAVQSIWETGLRMPANGVLLAVAAAVATHRSAVARQ